MKIAAILQARMSSQRLPGKVLQRVAGKPMLHYLIERLNHCAALNHIIVATSQDPSDDPICEFCRDRGIDFHRGSLSKVIERFRDVVLKYRLDAFVRINGDSPLLDPALIEKAVGLFLGNAYDVVTNVEVRTYPPGESVEVVRSASFEKAFRLAKEPEDIEHVTKVFYKHPTLFRIFNIKADPPYQNIHLAVDTADDMAMFTKLVERMQKPQWQYGLDEIVTLYRGIPQSVQPS